MKFAIGKSAEGKVEMDLVRLIGTKALAVANSGGGKSWLFRLIAEQTLPTTQTIIIDPEGEFSTLRERHDILIVARDGEIQPDPKTAKLLARKLAELRISAVIDLYDLHPQARRSFVRQFADAIVDLPKTLWGPKIVMVDEAHMFCPEKGHGEAESTNAIIGLMSLGRKRGLCGILATQRISKLHKDAAAECNNVFIGKTTLDVDQRRAGDIMGVGKDESRALRNLEPLNFHAFGPALSQNGVFRLKLANVKTTHPRDGQRHTIAAPQPSKLITKVLPEFADLAKKADTEARDMEAARSQIRDLKRQVAAKVPGEPDPRAIDRATAAAVKEANSKNANTVRDLKRALDMAVKFLIKIDAQNFGGELGESIDGDQLKRAIENAVQSALKSVEQNLASRNRQVSTLKSEASRLLEAINGIRADRAVEIDISVTRNKPFTISHPKPAMAPTKPAERSAGDGVSLPKGERAILIAIAQHPEGVSREQLTVLTGYKRSSRDKYLQHLRERGMIEANGDAITVTSTGLNSLGSDYEPLPTGRELYEHWIGKLPAGEKSILETVAASYPSAVTRDDISGATGYKRSSRDKYMQHLAARKLITVGPDGATASAALFD